MIGAVCLFSIWKGGAEERVAAITYGSAALVAPLIRDQRWIGTQWGLFWVDAVCFSLLLIIAMRTKRYWPIWAAGFQLLALLMHPASMVDKAVGAWAYITAGIIWTYLTLFAIGIGAWNHWMMRRQLAAFRAGDPPDDPFGGASRR